MNKKLVIIRHAKSSWADIGMSDIERPLNDRGRSDAPEMGERLLAYGLMPDLIYTSAAKRTQQTTAAITKAMRFGGEVLILEKLYHAPATVIEDVIATTDDRHDTIFIVAHNPGVTEFLHLHCKRSVTDDMPTCAIAAFELQADSWADLHAAQMELIRYDHPKNR